jgi:hypothetical protein
MRFSVAFPEQNEGYSFPVHEIPAAADSFTALEYLVVAFEKSGSASECVTTQLEVPEYRSRTS